MGRQNAVLPAPAPPPVEGKACPRRCEWQQIAKCSGVFCCYKGVWRKAGGLGTQLRGQGLFGWLGSPSEDMSAERIANGTLTSTACWLAESGGAADSAPPSALATVTAAAARPRPLRMLPHTLPVMRPTLLPKPPTAEPMSSDNSCDSRV